MKKVQFIITATILSFGLIISAALISNAIYNSDRSQSRITVKGVAEKRVKADKAIINIIFSTLKYREFEYKKELIIENNMDFLTNINKRRYVQK